MSAYVCKSCGHETARWAPSCPNCLTTPSTLAEHPAQAKQRAKMHDAVADWAAYRRKAEQADARRNQPITRGEILDALDQAMHVRGGNVGDHNEADMELLRALREAFE